MTFNAFYSHFKCTLLLNNVSIDLPVKHVIFRKKLKILLIWINVVCLKTSWYVCGSEWWWLNGIGACKFKMTSNEAILFTFWA